MRSGPVSADVVQAFAAMDAAQAGLRKLNFAAADGCTEWIPPPELDRAARANHCQHPEHLFDDDDAP